MAAVVQRGRPACCKQRQHSRWYHAKAQQQLGIAQAAACALFFVCHCDQGTRLALQSKLQRVREGDVAAALLHGAAARNEQQHHLQCQHVQARQQRGNAHIAASVCSSMLYCSTSMAPECCSVPSMALVAAAATKWKEACSASLPMRRA